MCFGGGNSKTPSVSAPPPMAPPPVIQPTEISAASAGEARRKKLEQLRFGLASTIKTSPKGITGVKPDLQAPALAGQKTTFGG